MSNITSSGLGTAIQHTEGTPTWNIRGGTLSSNNSNLFHSFGEFSIGLGDMARFQNLNAAGTALLVPDAASVANILGRVTGTSPNPPTISTILGTIHTTDFPNASLFLMNPAGFLFGPDATVNVGGMVTFTTADYLRLTDGVQFEAAIPSAQDALLSAMPVAAFGFLGSNPGAITIQGSRLAVQDGTGISMVGGDITVQSGSQSARLSAPNGQIKMASAASPGEFLLANLQSAPNVDGASFTSSGTLSLAAGSTIDVSGTSTVSIRGGRFVLSVNDAVLSTSVTPGAPDTISLSKGSSLVTANAGADPGADAQIITGNLQMDGASTKSMTTGDGLGGAILIDSGQSVSLMNGAGILSHSEGAGPGGNITVTATDTVKLSGGDPPRLGFSTIESRALGSGDGGDTMVTARTLTIENGGRVVSDQTFEDAGPAGTQGNITIMADKVSISGIFDLPSGFQQPSGITSQSVVFGADPNDAAPVINISASSVNINRGFIDSVMFGERRGPDITLAVDNLSITGGGRITAGSEGFGSVSGTIFITASDTVSISGKFPNVPSPQTRSRIEDRAGFDSIAVGGLTIQTGKLIVSDDARINYQSDGMAQGEGIRIDASESVTISSLGKIRMEGFDAQPGTLEISAPTISMDQGNIQTLTVSTGDAAPIVLNATNATGTAGTLRLSGGSTITSETVEGLALGGPITINAADSVLISEGSTVTSSTAFAEAPAGPISITATNLVSLTGDGTQVLSETLGAGNGGDITVKAKEVRATDGASFSARSFGSGNAGTVTIQGPASPAESVLIDGAGSGIFTETQGEGTGGNINLFAQSFTMQNGATVSAATSSTAASATGGTILVNAIVQDGIITPTAAQSVTLSNGATISATSTGPANAGDIVINAGQNYTSTNSSVATQATAPGTQASGGNITVLATDTAQLTNSQINASVQGSTTTKGGTIVIDPQFVILQNSQILAQATQGQGGTINIFFTGAFLPDANSVVSASSQTGISGTVNIQSPISQAGGKIVPLSNKPVETTALLSQRCVAAAASGEYSSFVVAGRDTLPAEPGGWLASPLVSLTGGEGLGAAGEGTVSVRRLPPNGAMAHVFSTDVSGSCGS